MVQTTKAVCKVYFLPLSLYLDLYTSLLLLQNDG